MEQREGEKSPQGAQNELDDLGGKAATPSNAHRHQECAGNVRNERIDRTNTPDRNRAPGGHRGEKGESRGVKVDLDHQNVVDDA